jgi:integrase
MAKPTKLTERFVEGLQPGETTRFHWDSELKGLGIRLFPSGTRKFVLQYRTTGGQQRRLSLGSFPSLTCERARKLAKKHLGEIIEGADPAAAKSAYRTAMSVAELCDAYMAAAEDGLILGRRGLAKKDSTLATDRGRIDRHIKPLLGSLKAEDVKRPNIEAFKNAVATGKTAKVEKTKLRGRAVVTGGKGTATRTLGLLGGIFTWGIAQGIVTTNPVLGVKRFAGRPRKHMLTFDQYRALGDALASLEAKRTANGKARHHELGLAAIRYLALTGGRRGDAVNLQWNWIDAPNATLRLGDSKTGESIRPIGKPALELLAHLPRISKHVFAACPDGGGYQGLPKLWAVVQAEARGTDQPEGASGPLDEVTLHSFRHSFAGHADELGCSVPTIAAILGQKLAGVTAGYILKRVDRPLVASADRIAYRIDSAMRGIQPASNVHQIAL